MQKRKVKKLPAKKAKVAKVTKTVITTTTTTTTTTATGHLKNRIGIIIDASGSMASMHQEVVNALNGQVDVIKSKNKDMDTQVSLLTFNDTIHPNFLNAPVTRLNKIAHHDYNPSGSTALYDAIGYMIDEFQKLPEALDPDCSFLLVIVTDGQENASRRYSYGMVRERIQSLEKTGRWTFSYLGAAEGLQDVGASLGIAAGNTLTGGNLRMNNVYATVASASMDSFMTARGVKGMSAVSNFYDPNQDQDDQTTGKVDTTQTKVTTTSTTAPVKQEKAGSA